MEKDTYEFNETKHLHTLNGKPLTGVTTILGVIAKPMLIQWSANMAIQYVLDAIADGRGVTSEVLKEAKTAHRRKKEEAGVKGKDVHSDIEVLIKEAIEHSKGVIGEYAGDNGQVRYFVQWASANNVKFLASEEHIYSKDWWVGGICDFLCEIEGELWVGDIKTSSGIYPEHFFQTAAYQKMYQEMGLHLNFKGNVILNLRKDGTFEEKRSVSTADNLEAFESAVKLYRAIEKINKTII